MATETSAIVQGADAAKAAALGHPVILAVVGGAILGAGIYYGVQKFRQNRADKKAEETAATATEEPAAAAAAA